MRASLQFSNDNFSYWFASDVGSNEAARKPITGTYSVDGWRISLHPEDDRTVFSQDWYVFRHNGCLTLMPASEYRNWIENGSFRASRLLWHLDSFDTNDPLARLSCGLIFTGRPLKFELQDSRSASPDRRVITYHVRARNSGDAEDLDLVITTNSPSAYSGALPTTVGRAHPSNGVLEVSESDRVECELLLAHASELNIMTNAPPFEIQAVPLKKWRWGEPYPPGDVLKSEPEE